ncbi:MAG: cytochrome oxidase small assembly protein [Rhodocyclaceae bacterium]
MNNSQKGRNLRMLLILASIAAAFFLGFIVKTWLFGR